MIIQNSSTTSILTIDYFEADRANWPYYDNQKAIQLFSELFLSVVYCRK